MRVWSGADCGANEEKDGVDCKAADGCSPLLQIGAMVVQPLYIPVGGGSVSDAFGLSERHEGGRLQPAMRLRMPVGKREPIRPVVVGARIINHPVGIVRSDAKEFPVLLISTQKERSLIVSLLSSNVT